MMTRSETAIVMMPGFRKRPPTVGARPSAPLRPAKGDLPQWELSTDGRRSSPARHAGLAARPPSSLAEQGARVLVNDIDADVEEQAAAEIGGETAVFGGDLTKEGVCDQLVQKAASELGGIDIIVNNAGYTWDGVAHKMEDRQFQAMLDIPHGRPVSRPPRRRAAPARTGEEGARGGPRGLPQGRERQLGVGNDGQRRPGQLLGRQGRRSRPHEDARQGVGQFKVNVNAVAFGFVETRLTASKEEGGKFKRTARRSSSGFRSRCGRWRR